MDHGPRRMILRSLKLSRPNSMTRRTNMATKSDFTAQEWETLRNAPHLVMLSVATAGSSGPFGSIKEAFAPAGAIIEAAKGSNELLKGICDREEIKAAQKSIRSSIKIGSDDHSLREQLQWAASDKAAEANAVLKKKGSPEDLEAYRQLLVEIADRTAKAAKEGGFLGFGGEWVSEGERAVITRISQALEVQPA
jgi:hypothetical protein